MGYLQAAIEQRSSHPLSAALSVAQSAGIDTNMLQEVCVQLARLESAEKRLLATLHSESRGIEHAAVPAAKPPVNRADALEIPACNQQELVIAPPSAASGTPWPSFLHHSRAAVDPWSSCSC